MHLTGLDLGVLAAYAAILLAVALWVSREPAGHHKTTEDYFLAGKSLPWWAIGASLIAANISAEQVIGMSGQGFAVGLAIAAYEWQAAFVLLIVAKYFLPIFLKRGVYTMPQFLDQRFGHTVKVTLSIYWIALYTAVNLTTVLWLGGLAVHSMTGLAPLAAMASLAAFAIAYSMYGGLKAVALTDAIQVAILVLGGLIIAWITLSMIGGGAGPIAGAGRLYAELPGHFDMILDRSHPAFRDLPGIWTLLGGLWVLHFSYWGFNQYIIQRALGAESVAEAQKGLAFAAFLKLLMPVIIVLPGIAAVLLSTPLYGEAIDPRALGAASDRTYPEVMKLMPDGLKGLVFAALVAAIVSSLASMTNSISTIFTMDVYRAVRTGRPEGHYVAVGRIAALVAMVLALALAQPLLGGLESAFQHIQEYTGFIAPGVVIVFLLGMFWPRATAAGAFAALVVSFAGSLVLKLALPELEFVNRIWLVFLSGLTVAVVVSLLTPKPEEGRAVRLSDISFATSATFNLAGAVIIAALVLIYAVFW